MLHQNNTTKTMKTIYAYFLCILGVVSISIYSCDDNNEPTGDDIAIDWDTVSTVNPAYQLEQPSNLPPIPVSDSNPLTTEGVELGRRLFYDPILSANNTQSCASCHAQQFGFTDNLRQFSIGIDGIAGNRNAMAIINLPYVTPLFWDGRSASLEDQALQPITNPIEMHNTWEKAVDDLMKSVDYRVRFYKAFGSKQITKELVARAIAQFERTLISGKSKYDLAITPGSGVFLTDQEYLGYTLFINEEGDCFHCHTPGSNLFSDNKFHNNGLDTVSNVNDYADKGLGDITKNPEDNGYFRTTTLRNIELTAPYMHDGRFQTLEQVVDHYSEHVKQAPNVDPTIKVFFKNGGKHLSPENKQALVAFLKTLTDTSFVNNPAFKTPF